MNELIRVQEKDGQQVVSARELHGFLTIRSKFADWLKNRINKYGFVENQDFVTVSKILENGGRELDYALTLDMAKELAMVEGNEKGKQARQYFIDCEKRANRPLSPAELLLQQAKVLVEQERRITQLETTVNSLVSIQQQAAQQLLELPKSDILPPEQTTRSKIVQRINQYCHAGSLRQEDVWNRVYNRLYYLYGVSIKSHKRKSGESWLDVAERTGNIERIFSIVSAELTYRE